MAKRTTRRRGSGAGNRGPLRKLGPRHVRFIAEYLTDLDAKNAYRRAGFKATGNAAEVNGARLLKDPLVAAALASAQAQHLQKVEMTAQDVLHAIARQVTRDIRTLFDAKGNHRPIHELSAEEAAMIDSYEVIIKNAKAGDGHTDEVLKVRLQKQVTYVELAAKHFALLTEVIRHTADDALIDKLTAALAAGRARVAALRAPTPASKAAADPATHAGRAKARHH